MTFLKRAKPPCSVTCSIRMEKPLPLPTFITTRPSRAPAFNVIRGEVCSRFPETPRNKNVATPVQERRHIWRSPQSEFTYLFGAGGRLAGVTHFKAPFTIEHPLVGVGVGEGTGVGVGLGCGMGGTYGHVASGWLLMKLLKVLVSPWAMPTP